MMEFRNPRFNAFGTIDCEIEHPNLGWIPFTADPGDDVPHGAEIYHSALAANPAPYVAPIQTLTSADVDAERDRRLYGTFSFMGYAFDADRDSQMRIAGAALQASIAIAAGAEAGNLYWTGGSSPFSWIAADNMLVTMDAPTTIAFGQAAAAHITAHIFAGRAIKALDPIPLDYTDPSRWP